MAANLEDHLSFVDSSVELPTKPDVSLHYTYNQASRLSNDIPDYLLVCLNGLLVPQAGWFPALLELSRRCRSAGLARPALLTYDRWAQGRTTDQDPLDSAPGRDPKYGHDIQDVVHDLHQLLLAVAKDQSNHEANKMTLPPLIFLANSIGCAIARVYAQTYPGTAHAFIFLDSIMTHSDFVTSLWPDPDSPSFDAAASLPEGVPASALRNARDQYSRLFHPTVPNAEHLDRRTLATLLPSPSSPRLPVVDATGERPLLVVIGHDPETFAKEGEERLGVPAALTLMHAHARWHEYNEGLTKLTESDRVRGPVIAKGCAHFVQRDGPGFVADVLADVLETLVRGKPLKHYT